MLETGERVAMTPLHSARSSARLPLVVRTAARSRNFPLRTFHAPDNSPDRRIR